MTPHTEDIFAYTPCTAEEVAASLLLAGKKQETLSCFKADIDLGLASVWLELSGLKAIRSHCIPDFTVTVETGMTFGALNQALRLRGQALSLSYPDITPLHQVLAWDLAAPETGLTAGYPRDEVLGLEVAGADGTVTKCGGTVVKNVTGYDLNKLYVGSHHSLAIPTACTFKTIPLPAMSWEALFWMPNGQAASSANLFQALGEEIANGVVATCEWLSLPLLPALLEPPSGPSSSFGMFDGAWWIALRGSEQQVLSHQKLLLQKAKTNGWVPTAISGEAHQALLSAVSPTPERTEGFTLEIALPAGRFFTACRQLEKLLPTFSVYCHSRPAAGLVWVYGLDASKSSRAAIPVLLETLSNWVATQQGVLKVVSTPTAEEDVFWQQLIQRYNLPEDPVLCQLHQALKHQYDPAAILASRFLPSPSKALPDLSVV